MRLNTTCLSTASGNTRVDDKFEPQCKGSWVCSGVFWRPTRRGSGLETGYLCLHESGKWARVSRNGDSRVPLPAICDDDTAVSERVNKKPRRRSTGGPKLDTAGVASDLAELPAPPCEDSSATGPTHFTASSDSAVALGTELPGNTHHDIIVGVVRGSAAVDHSLSSGTDPAPDAIPPLIGTDVGVGIDTAGDGAGANVGVGVGDAAVDGLMSDDPSTSVVLASTDTNANVVVQPDPAPNQPSPSLQPGQVSPSRDPPEKSRIVESLELAASMADVVVEQDALPTGISPVDDVNDDMDEDVDQLVGGEDGEDRDQGFFLEPIRRVVVLYDGNADVRCLIVMPPRAWHVCLTHCTLTCIVCSGIFPS